MTLMSIMAIAYCIMLLYVMYRLGKVLYTAYKMQQDGYSSGSVLRHKWHVIRHCLLIWIPFTVVFVITYKLVMG